MISTTQKYKQEIIAGNRRYVVKAEVTLKDSTTFDLTNQELWEQGVTIDNAISSNSSFDIGSAIIGSLTLVIDNIKGDYNTYDFMGANIVLYIGLENDVDQNDDQIYYRIGYYVVDDTTYNGSLITLKCLDNMTWFDVPFSGLTGLSFPTTAGQLVADICSYVGVTLGVAHFQNYTMPISQESGEWLAKNDVNCREVLQYIAQKCCCYCKINTAGELILKWHDKQEIIGITNYDGGTYHTNTTPYSDGCELDGGHFNPWDGDSADGGTFTDLQQGAWLTQNYEMNVSTDAITVTGARVRSTSGENAYDELWVDTTLEQTHERYVLVIENNPLITATEASNVANIIGSVLAGLPIRAFTSRSLNDLSYETGDMVTIVDFRGNLYYTWITALTFTTGNSENFSCGAESLKERSETRFSESAKTLAEAQQNADKMLSDYDTAVKAMNELAQSAIAYHKYEYEVNNATITWLYNGNNIDTTDPDDPVFSDSTVVFKISGDGVFISNGIDPQTGKQVYTQGYDANSGTAILSLIYAVGINCDWIHAGTLTLGGDGNENGLCSVLDAQGAETVRLDENGLKAVAGSIDGTLTIGADGYLGSTAGNMKGLKIGNGTLGVSVDRGSSWAGLCFGEEAASRTGWSKGCCVLWNGGDSGAGFHVISGAPSSGNSGNFSALKQSRLEFWENYNLSYYYDTGGGHSGSDKRLKKNIKSFTKTSIRKFFELINPVSFAFKSDNKKHFGIVAQELEEVLNAANLNNDVLIEETLTKDKYKAVAYSEFHGLELAGIKDLYTIVNKQQEEINQLKKDLAELKARIK